MFLSANSAGDIVDNKLYIAISDIFYFNLIGCCRDDS